MTGFLDDFPPLVSASKRLAEVPAAASPEAPEASAVSPEAPVEVLLPPVAAPATAAVSPPGASSALAAPASPQTLARQREALQADVARAAAHALNARAKNTVRTYKALWSRFEDWCAATGNAPLPAEPLAVAAYLAWRVSEPPVSAATIRGSLSAIAYYHMIAGHDFNARHPFIQQAREGILRQLGTRQKGKTPLLKEELKQIVTGKLSARDRALILLGWHSACRRGELVALRLTEVEITEKGVHLLVAKSKTDQLGEGIEKFIPHAENPMLRRALERWIARRAERFTASPWLFPWRFDPTQHLPEVKVADVVKRAVKAVGLKPNKYAGHSLRAGFVTAARQAGWSNSAIQARTGHQKADTLDRYDRRSQLEKATTGAKPLL